jgi:hypothetical protein
MISIASTAAKQIAEVIRNPRNGAPLTRKARLRARHLERFQFLGQNGTDFVSLLPPLHALNFDGCV